MATFDDGEWSEDSNMGECDPGAQIGILTIHMRPLHISSKCRSFLMIRRTVGNSTLGWISALGIPMFTSGRLPQNHMKLLRMSANLTGAFCSASF